MYSGVFVVFLCINRNIVRLRLLLQRKCGCSPPRLRGCRELGRARSARHFGSKHAILHEHVAPSHSPAWRGHSTLPKQSPDRHGRYLHSCPHEFSHSAQASDFRGWRASASLLESVPAWERMTWHRQPSRATARTSDGQSARGHKVI